MVVATVKFHGKDGLGTPYSYLADEELAAHTDEGSWVIVESDRSKYNLGVFCGMSEDQDYLNKPFVMKKIIMATGLPKEEI
jgi:hypothetical protein